MKITCALGALLLLAACDGASSQSSAQKQSIKAIAEIGAGQQHILGSWKLTNPNIGSTTLRFDPYPMGAQWGNLEYNGKSSFGKSSWQFAGPNTIKYKNENQKTPYTCIVDIQEKTMTMTCGNRKTDRFERV